jgi:hypothetical protein
VIDRFTILDAARAAVTQREKHYGKPEDNFGRIAGMWSAWKGVPFADWEVAAMLALVKWARVAADPFHPDSQVDAAGYAACCGELTAKASAEVDEIAEATA